MIFVENEFAPLKKVVLAHRNLVIQQNSTQKILDF